MTFKVLLRQIRSDISPTHKITVIKIIRKFFFSNSFRLILNYRIGRFFHLRGAKVICKILKYNQIKKHSCQISYKAIIGKQIEFPHPIGIVIGDNVRIDDSVKIWQNVTLGSHGKSNEDLTYPSISKEVKIFANSMVIGGVTVGQGAIVGAMSLVLKDVPDNKVATGIPADVR